LTSKKKEKKKKRKRENNITNLNTFHQNTNKREGGKYTNLYFTKEEGKKGEEKLLLYAVLKKQNKERKMYTKPFSPPRKKREGEEKKRKTYEYGQLNGKKNQEVIEGGRKLTIASTLWVKKKGKKGKKTPSRHHPL